jgi:peptide/nickel transport system ATP-binding protein/oligopeptide transport system ATP-binding protein
MSDGEPLLHVRDLRVEIPTPRGVVRAVDGASFALRRGGSLGLVGESGCGKSMTLRAILGLLPSPGHVAGGAVEFDGRDLTTLRRDHLRALRGRAIGMIFQEPMTALNPVMRVGDQIAEGPRVRLGQSRRAATGTALELMREVGIPDPKRRYEAYPHELSGGMRQRVMIAIAISCEPSLVLCDEPTTALDVTIQDQILKLLARLCREHGTSVVFVTHDLAVIAQTCETVAVMYAGQVVETGTVDAVFREPRHPYTLALLRSVPDAITLRDRLVSIPGRPPDLVAPPAGCPFAPRCVLALESCTHGEFPLRALAAGRATACVRDEACAADARSDPVIA